MKLTSKGRYAVTAILDIALFGTDGPVTLSDISERQHISLSYLEQLFAKLRRHGLVKSVRGPGGGYRLGHDMDKISIGMIIAAVNENITVTKCLGKGNCQNGTECLTHSLWAELSHRIEDFLDKICARKNTFPFALWPARQISLKELWSAGLKDIAQVESMRSILKSCMSAIDLQHYIQANL